MFIQNECLIVFFFLVFFSGAVVDESNGKVLVVQDRNKVYVRVTLLYPRAPC